MNETTFEKAVVGDRVWSVNWGWGKIVEFAYDSLVVEFGDTRFHFDESGKRRFIYDTNKTLFWDEIKIVAPVKPKPHKPKNKPQNKTQNKTQGGAAGRQAL